MPTASFFSSSTFAYAADLPDQVWRADALAAPQADTVSSGDAALDAQLPGGGWPAAGVTELLLAAPGSAELRLLAPLLALAGGASIAAALWREGQRV